MQLPTRVIKAKSKILLRRTLPVPGEILVQPGQTVEALDVVAQAEMPSRYRMINVAKQLGRSEIDMGEVMRAKVGDYVTANQVIAALKGRLPFLQRSVRAPVAGHVAVIGPGWVLLETERSAIKLQAFIGGQVNRIIPNKGVIIEAHGAIIEAACGFGGEAHGRLKRLVNSPYEELKVEKLDENASNAIVLGGRTLNEDTLRKAEQWQVRGIIVGSIDAALMQATPPSKVRVVATEGFGDMPMSPYTFSILTSLSRQEVSIRGQTPHLSYLSRRIPVEEMPLVLAAGSAATSSPTINAESQKTTTVTKGSRVRVTRGRRLGSTGAIDSLPAEPHPTEAGILVPGAYVSFNDGTQFIPWANLEFIE